MLRPALEEFAQGLQARVLLPLNEEIRAFADLRTTTLAAHQAAKLELEHYARKGTSPDALPPLPPGESRRSTRAASHHRWWLLAEDATTASHLTTAGRGGHVLLGVTTAAVAFSA